MVFLVKVTVSVQKDFLLMQMYRRVNLTALIAISVWISFWCTHWRTNVFLFWMGKHANWTRSMFRLPAAIFCIQRLLALHPLNPEYWIQFAKLTEQTLGSTSGTPPDKSPETSSIPSSTTTSTNVHEKLSSAPILRLSLYNPDYPCRMCVLENCTSCCIYRHKISEIRTRAECCSECPKQDLAPEVHFLTMSCTCWGNPEGDSISLLDVVRKSKISHGGCTILLQTPHQTHSDNKYNQGSQTGLNKDLGFDIHELCEKLNDGILDDEETVKTVKGHVDVNRRKAMCIALVRAR